MKHRSTSESGGQPARPPPKPGRDGWPLVLQHLGIDDIALIELQTLIARLAGELGLDLRLDQYVGDAVLADENLLRSVRPQLVAAFCEGRPVVAVSREPCPPGAVRGAINAAVLRKQLWALVHGKPAPAPPAPLFPGTTSAADSSRAEPAWPQYHPGAGSALEPYFDQRLPAAALADEPIDTATQAFVDALHAGLSDPTHAPILACYEGGARMVIDFARSQVLIEPEAEATLRLAHWLPVLDAGPLPTWGVHSCELDRVLWFLGWAGGRHPLHAAGDDWWRQPLVALTPHGVWRHSAVPLHLEMARALAEGPMTPAQLRQKCRADVAELRCFLQAGLWLGLLGWLQAGAGVTGLGTGRRLRGDSENP